MGDDPGRPSVLRVWRSPLVGRARELAILADHLAETCRPVGTRRPAVVMLAGEPGIGKSRLLEEFLPPEQAKDVTVLRGGASRAEGMPPYLPFLEALGDYVASAPSDRLREQVGPSAAILATFLPEISAQLGPPTTLYPLGPEQERFRLYEAVAAFLAAIASRGPLVLVLDDLQWADAATFDLLVHVAGRSQSAALLVVGAYREDEVQENAAFVRALAELNRRRLLVTLRLDRLDVSEGRLLAGNLLGGEMAPDVADLLHRHGEGNPFFLEELLRALVDEGALFFHDGQWTLRELPGRLLPPRVAEAIRMRTARLDPAVVDVLRTAAVVGRSCDSSLLARVAQIDVEEVEERLLEAARADLIRPDADGTYTFTHDMVRETLQDEVGRARRRRLHLAIGEALEVEGRDSLPHRLADLAFHFAEAGATDRGVLYALASGERALRASAAREAMAHYRTAIRLLEPGGEIAQRAVALIGLGDAATLAGDYHGAADSYLAAREAWSRGDDSRAAARALYRLGRVRRRQEAVVAAREAFEEALALLGSEDSPDAAEALLQLADLYATSLGRNAEGLACAERALAMVERLGDRRLEATACCVIGSVRARSNDLAAGRESLERALALARELDEPALGAEVCAYLANVYAWTAELDRSLELSVLRGELARRTQDVFHLRDVYSWIGFQEVIRGRWAEAEQWFTQQELIVQGIESPEPRATLRAYRGILRYYQGRFAEADRAMRDVVDLLRPTGSPTVVWYLGWWGQILAELGRADEALQNFAELHALADRMDERARARGNAFAQLAVGYGRVGARERAADCYAKLLPFHGQISPVMIDRGLGVAALAAGDRGAARRHLADAEALARRAGMRPELAIILLQRGLLERDDPGVGPSRSAMTVGHGSGPLDDGLRLCAELDMLELGRRMLGPVAADQGPSLRREAVPAGLSDREREVLHLVAQGLTNREIAETLVLSEKTVARHLTNIFTKIGVENRAGATAFAFRRGLA